MPRAFAVVFAIAVVVAQPVAARAETPASAGYRVAATAALYDGVEYVKVTRAKNPVVAHVAHLLPGAAVDLRVVNANDRIASNTKGLETTSSMCARVHCIVGLNGDFHKAGVPAGAVVVDGCLLHSPDPARPQLTVTKDGKLVAGALPWTGSLAATGFGPVALSRVNEAPPANGLALFTPEFGPGTEASTRTELVVRAPAVGALNQAATLELVSLRTGAGPIPADGAVLSGDGTAGQQLADLWGRRQALAGPARLLMSSPVDARMSIGAEPVVLADGKRADGWRDPNVINPRQPHTLVGWNKGGDVYLVAVDGRQTASDGMTMAEAADFLLGLGATDAVNLDGGGGTTFVAGGAVWNRPSDNDPGRPGAYDERGATNAFVVTARPGAPPPPEVPPAPAPLPGGEQPATVFPLPVVSGPGVIPGPAQADPGGGGGTPFVPVVGIGGQLADEELPVGPSAAGSAARPHGHAALPRAEDGSSETAAEDSSLVAQARSELKRGADRPSDAGDYLRNTLSLAATLTAPAVPIGTGPDSGRPNAVHALAAGAIAVAALSRLSRRRRRSQIPTG